VRTGRFCQRLLEYGMSLLHRSARRHPRDDLTIVKAGEAQECHTAKTTASHRRWRRIRPPAVHRLPPAIRGRSCSAWPRGPFSRRADRRGTGKSLNQWWRRSGSRELIAAQIHLGEPPWARTHLPRRLGLQGLSIRGRVNNRSVLSFDSANQWGRPEPCFRPVA